MLDLRNEYKPNDTRADPGRGRASTQAEALQRSRASAPDSKVQGQRPEWAAVQRSAGNVFENAVRMAKAIESEGYHIREG